MDKSLFLALDFPNWEVTNNFLVEHQLQGVPVKVGMELFYREGPNIIEKLKRDNHKIFLDLKLHDIPNTVMQAMKNIAGLGVDVVNVHALGGTEMIKYAKEGLIDGATHQLSPKLIAVTILTSMNQKMMNNELQLSGNVSEQAVHLAKLAYGSGADGVVCSAHEATEIKVACDKSFLTVTPGIRLTNSSKDDQQRVATPAFARENGADMIVIGRSITKAKDPRRAYEQAVTEWRGSNGFCS